MFDSYFDLFCLVRWIIKHMAARSQTQQHTTIYQNFYCHPFHVNLRVEYIWNGSFSVSILCSNISKDGCICFPFQTGLSCVPNADILTWQSKISYFAKSVYLLQRYDFSSIEFTLSLRRWHRYECCHEYWISNEERARYKATYKKNENTLKYCILSKE